MELFKYKGFISYSHDDEKWGSWLHRKLETYRFPRRTIGLTTKNGVVPERFSPVFRDRDELTAGADLGAEIQQSLRQSENLIVLCSPRAAQSYWVNKEILYFKQHNNPDNIFAFIVDGQPFAPKGQEDQECLPPALRYEMGASGALTEKVLEPLAADARTIGDGKSLALLKLLSGMTGLGLDDLVQRDLQRARRRVTLITVSAISAMLVMGALTGIALEARGEAESRRADAEGLIEFMLTDLRDRLEPVGKLDILDSVGLEASNYYDSYENESLGADAIGRRAKAFHLLGDIQLRMGNFEAAKAYFNPAFEFTAKQLESDPNNPERIYEHIQSVFWKAEPLKHSKQYNEMLDAYETYEQLAQRLFVLEGDSDRSLIERAWGVSNIGKAYFHLEKYELAVEYAEKSIPLLLSNLERRRTPEIFIALARSYSDLSDYNYKQNKKEIGFEWERKSGRVLKQAMDIYPKNYQILSEIIAAEYGLAVYLVEKGDYSEAKATLLSNLERIEAALKIEPNNNHVLLNRLDIHDYLAEIGLKTSDYSFAERHLNLKGRLIEDRLNSPIVYEFDPRWDYREPRDYVRKKIQLGIGTSDFEKAADTLPLLEKVIQKLEGRPGFEREYYAQYGYYLLTKTFLNDDIDAYRHFLELNATGKHPDLFKSYLPMFALMGNKFCIERRICESSSYKLDDVDFTSNQYNIFKQKNPEIAQTILTKYRGERNE